MGVVAVGVMVGGAVAVGELVGGAVEVGAAVMVGDPDRIPGGTDVDGPGDGAVPVFVAAVDGGTAGVRVTVR